MNGPFRKPVAAACLAAAALLLPGCGDSSADLDEAYGLDATAEARGPGRTVLEIVTIMEQQIRGESGPLTAAAEAEENLANFRASEFGGEAPAFENLVAGVGELRRMAEAKAAKAEILERAADLKDQAERLAGDDAAGKAPPAAG